eukprot:m.293701 g.293701  ORF g.293701 m.293701 type:complete len:87 (-) comp29155_c0_seq1:527-787(-)
MLRCFKTCWKPAQIQDPYCSSLLSGVPTLSFQVSGAACQSPIDFKKALDWASGVASHHLPLTRRLDGPAMLMLLCALASSDVNRDL